MTDTTTIVTNGKDIYEIIDTMVKIGLGALIGGVFSFITLKSNQKHEILKEKRSLKIKIIEENSLIVNNYFTHSYKLLNYMYGLTDNNKTNYSYLNEEEKKKLNAIDTEYLNSMHKMEEVSSKFSIIGFNKVEDLMREHDHPILNMRNETIVNNSDFLTKQEIEKLNNSLRKIKKSFNYEINQYFENLK